MAKARVFEISKRYARGYEFPPGRKPSMRPNPAGVTAIMGLSNGRGAAKRAKASARCRDDRGRFISCDDGYEANTREDDIADRRRGRMTRRKKRQVRRWVDKRQRASSSAVRRMKRAHDRIERSVSSSKRSRKSTRRCRKTKRSRLAWRDYESPSTLSPRRRKYRSRARRNGSESEFLDNRIRSQGAGDMYGEYELDFGDDEGGEGWEPNRRRRGRKSRKAGKRRGKRRARWSRKSRRTSRKRTRWSRKRRTSRTSKKRSRWSRKRRTSRGSRRSSRGRFGRKSRGRSRKSRRGSSRRRGYRRNGYAANLYGVPGRGPHAEGRAYSLEYQRMKAGLAGMSPSDRKAAVQALKKRHLKHMMKGHQRELIGTVRRERQAWPWGSPTFAPWDRPKPPRPPKPKYPPGTRDLLMRGYSPSHLFKAMKDLTADQVRAMFPTYGAYKRFMRQVMRDRRFRRYRSRFSRGARRFRGWGRKRRFGKRWGKSRRYGRKSRRYGRKSRRWGRWSKSRRYGRGRKSRRYGRGRRRGYRRGRRGYRRGYRRNFGMVPNMPYTGVKELAVAGLCAMLGYGLPQVVGGALGKFVHPLAGIVGGLIAGAGTVYAADKVFDETDAYAKGAAIGGLLGILASAGQAILMLIKPKAAAGFGYVGSQPTTRYVLNPFGQFVQASAGMGQFQQAQAGFGEYVQGTGEYVANDGSMMPVSDFGEYVSSGINVEGYSDYEVLPEYASGADGLGYVNDGVHPNANMDREFDIMEAAAGLGQNFMQAQAGFGGASLQGARPGMASDYIPTVQSGYVASHGSSPDAGIFDVGGPNGVFG